MTGRGCASLAWPLAAPVVLCILFSSAGLASQPTAEGANLAAAAATAGAGGAGARGQAPAAQEQHIPAAGASVAGAPGGLLSLVSVSGGEDLAGQLLLEEQGEQRRERRPERRLAQAGTAWPGSVAWRGRFDTAHQLDYFAQFMLYGDPPPPSYRQVVRDPTSPNSRQPVLRVFYPQGSWSPSAPVPGGTIFFAHPYGQAGPPIAYLGATLEYEVYMPPDFPFVWGGKLPGLAGGVSNCGGGADPLTCWSVRIMWRRKGDGEAYMYVPEGRQGPDFCSQPPRTVCDYNYGVSLSRGAFKFTPGAWHRIALSVRMNDPGQANGVVEVALNGKRVIYYNKVAYRTMPGIQVDSIYFASFFGGSNASWAPPQDTYTLFRNIRLLRHADDPYPASAMAAAAAAGDAQEQPSSMTIRMQEPEWVFY